LVDPGPQCFWVHAELVTDAAEDAAAGTRVGFESDADHAHCSFTKLEGILLMGHDREVLSSASLSPLLPGRISSSSVPCHRRPVECWHVIGSEQCCWMTARMKAETCRAQAYGRLYWRGSTSPRPRTRSRSSTSRCRRPQVSARAEQARRCRPSRRPLSSSLTLAWMPFASSW